ncbi:hypothetical protein SynBIOSE41_01668 [Synechococcus sp. BIOS-E4-1]|nr:hypothetical protein SynBIOSE41_01668 [Synechococcus sp. BIOS-E4-1]
MAKDLDTGYTLKASALTGAFYCFNQPNKPAISFQYLARLNAVEQ